MSTYREPISLRALWLVTETVLLTTDIAISLKSSLIRLIAINTWWLEEDKTLRNKFSLCCTLLNFILIKHFSFRLLVTKNK